jgi:hypothetical protein
VTSPAGNTIDWPERTELSSSSDAGSPGTDGMDAVSWAGPWAAAGGRGTAAAEERSQVRAELGQLRSFDPMTRMLRDCS